ncbi:MAG: hypothetical protein H0V89_04405, partial [Deltaproteobacteria bacterium]|nr:hypothetical protein [Deltaproteobacteria bacterium]
ADGLTDFEERALGTNPLLVDTDGGGSRDGDEVDDGTNPLDPLDDIGCSYPNEPVANDPAPAAGVFSPTYVVVTVEGVHETGRFNDYSLDTDGDGITEDYPAAVYVDFVDPSFDILCTVVYDAEAMTPAANAWVTSSGGALHGAWDLDTSGGETDCDGLDLVAYGTTDVRDILDNYDWGIAFGELVDVAAPLEAAVVAAGLSWAADWEPYVNGFYVTLDRANADELGYTFGTEADCAVVDPAVTLPSLESPLPDDLLFGTTYFVYDFAGLSGVSGSCLPPVVDHYDPAWVPPAPVIAPVYYNVSFTAGLEAGTGPLIDFNDGFADFSGVMAINLYDNLGTALCVVEYDASTSVRIDPATLTTPNGPNLIYAAWEVTAVDGVTDCRQVQPGVFGSTDIRDLFDGLAWVVGVGPHDDLAASYAMYGYGVYGANELWTQYFSFDGINAYESALGLQVPWTVCPAADVYGALMDPTLGEQSGLQLGFPWYLYTL